MARTSTTDLTAAEVNVVQGLEPLGSALQTVRVNAGGTALEYVTAGAGDALTANPLSQFAATTSLELKGVISDETGSGALVFATSPTLVTPVLGTPASGTLTNCTGLPVAGITASTSTALGVGSIELGHASDTTISRVSAGVIAVEGSTVPTLSVANTWTATQTEKAVLYTNDAITAAANAATIPVTYRLHTVTNNSAATLTITLTTAGATDGQMHLIRILDFSAVAQTITWVNTENSSVTAPTTSNGSTTLFLTVGFIYNGATSKWRCISYA